MVGHLPSFFVLTLLEHSNSSDEFSIFFYKKKLLPCSWPGLWLSVLAGQQQSNDTYTKNFASARVIFFFFFSLGGGGGGGVFILILF